MNRLKRSFGAKLTAVILLCVMVIIFCVSFAGMLYLWEYDGFDSSFDAVKDRKLSDFCRDHCWNAHSAYFYDDSKYENPRFGYIITDKSGETLADCYDGGEYISRYVMDMDEYTVDGYLLSLTEQQQEMLDFLETVYGFRYWSIAVCAITFLTGVLLFIFILVSAGWHPGEDEPRPSWLDRTPFELVTFVIAFIAAAMLAGVDDMSLSSELFEITVVCAMLIADGLLFVLWCATLAARLKTGTFIKSFFCLRFLKWLAGGFWRLGMLGRTGLVIFVVAAGELIIALAVPNDGFQAVWFVEKLILIPALVHMLLSFRRVFGGTKEIASGNENFVIDTSNLHGGLKEHAEDLNNIRAGLSRALDERMRSERFQTELITNVSHDIKTPLTSVVTYVDLMSKEETDNEKLKEYIAVLQRQSGKLRKLIEDLIEASKATSGAVKVELARCSLDVLMDQVIGEYSDKLEQAGLECVLKKPEGSVYIMADGRHLWRVLDNLLSNACKYSQPGTRVYIDLAYGADKASIIIRNTSALALNMTEEELMSRFVRGDSSRHTEGSGLGLSIAESLTKVQGGTMRISIDGDLFKVMLTFDRA